MEVFRRIEGEEEEEDGEVVMLMERRMNSMSLRLKRSFFSLWRESQWRKARTRRENDYK